MREKKNVSETLFALLFLCSTEETQQGLSTLQGLLTLFLPLSSVAFVSHS